MELYVQDESTSIKPTDFCASQNYYTLNSQRKNENAEDMTFNTSDMSMYYASTSNSFRKSKVIATKPYRDFFTPTEKEFYRTNLNKCTSNTTRDNKIAYLERERSMNIRDTDNDEKYIYDSNSSESSASNSNIRFLTRNNIEECLFEKLSPNVGNNLKESNRQYESYLSSHAENNKFTQI